MTGIDSNRYSNRTTSIKPFRNFLENEIVKSGWGPPLRGSGESSKTIHLSRAIPRVEHADYRVEA